MAWGAVVYAVMSLHRIRPICPDCQRFMLMSFETDMWVCNCDDDRGGRRRRKPKPLPGGGIPPEVRAIFDTKAIAEPVE